jgi:hypothetical protein
LPALVVVFGDVGDWVCHVGAHSLKGK